MNSIVIDHSTKLVLQYVEKLRGTSTNKKKKLEKKSLAIRPSDFPGIPTQQLCDILLRFAYNGNYIDDIFREHLLGLVMDESITWKQVLHSIINTKTDRLYVKCQLCSLIQEMIPYVQIESFIDSYHADSLISIVQSTFHFVAQQILDLLSDEDELENIQMENDDVYRPYHYPLQSLNAIIRDDLCGMLLSICSFSEVSRLIERCHDAFSKLHRPDKTASALLEDLMDLHAGYHNTPEFEYIPEGLTLFDLKNPSIRILVPIFACFKNHESSEHIAGTIQAIAEIMRVSGDEVIFDLLHAAILLKCEESMDLLHLPKQHRVDFRWQSTTFFYKKLPQVMGHLIESNYIKPEEASRGLERALDDLTMMFDAADASWQNASFLTLINELEPILGKEATETLRDRRRDHMKSTAHLAPFAETDDKPISNTEIDKLLNSSMEVMQLQNGQNENFCQSLIQKVTSGDIDDFDATASILTVEGLLLKIGNLFSLKNKEAQEVSSTWSTEDRIQTFDITFLLLSRIIFKNPSVSIKLFVNGRPGKTEAEKAIFFKWSMWFIKRVAKQYKNEHKDEEEIDALRREVEMLVRLANAEVGLHDDGNENEEVDEDAPEREEETETIRTIEETPKNEEGKDSEVEPLIETVKPEDEEMPEVKNEEGSEKKKIEESGATDEKMDTSETEAKPETSQSTESPAKLENEPMEPEPFVSKETAVVLNEPDEKPFTPQPKRKIENVPITWHQIHCPLPRISKKLARTYLSRLKEGFAFWETNDSSLNLGSIIAAVPRIGQLLVEDHVEKRHRIDRRVAEESMLNILQAIDSMSCIFVCLVEWLDCQQDSPARTSLAITMNGSLERHIANLTSSSSEPANLNKWKFIQSTVQQIIHELIDKSPAFPEVTCTAFSTARRFCPFVARNEKPDQVKLKHAWYYMRQQSWASPHALRLLEHANIAGEYNAWSHIYINKTIKSGCLDIMKSSVDMIFSFLMLDDLNSIIRMHESLMDFWMSEDAGQCQIDGRFDPLSMRAVIRLMSQVMLIAEFTLDRLIHEGPELKEPISFVEPLDAPEPEDPDRREKWIFLLRSMLVRTINRFFKILRKGLLCTVVNTIIQLIKSIAGAIDCRSKRLLIRRIPPELIFQMAYIEPSSVDYALLNVFCDPENEEHTRTKILFLCAQKRAKNF